MNTKLVTARRLLAPDVEPPSSEAEPTEPKPWWERFREQTGVDVMAPMLLDRAHAAAAFTLEHGDGRARRVHRRRKGGHVVNRSGPLNRRLQRFERVSAGTLIPTAESTECFTGTTKIGRSRYPIGVHVGAGIPARCSAATSPGSLESP